MNASAIMAAFSALALGHALFLASHFWAPVRKKPSSFFLALLLTVLAIRIIKSVVVILIPQSPDIIPAIGLVGLSAIGPSLWLYLQSFKNPEFRAYTGLIWHYGLALVLPVLIPLLDEGQMYAAYCISVGHMLIYLLLAIHFVVKRNTYYSLQARQWLKLLIIATGLIWATFFTQLLIETFVAYLSVTIVASIVLYSLSIWAGKKTKLFIEPNRKMAETATETARIVGQQIAALLGQDEIYRDPDLSVRKLSARLLQPEYLISRAVNIHFGKRFPEVLNQYRIEHAVKLIRSGKHDHLSTEGIAYESGYKSLSAFYRSFKYLKGITPAKYRKEVDRKAKQSPM